MTGNDVGHEDEKPKGTDAERDLARRFERLGSVLDAKRLAAPLDNSDDLRRASNSNAIGDAFRLSAEFVAGVIAGATLGWLIDRMVGSSPWGLIVCLILGFCAGMFNLLRASGAVKPARQARHEADGAKASSDQPEV